MNRFVHQLLPFVFLLLVIVQIRAAARVDLLKANGENVRHADRLLLVTVARRVQPKPVVERTLVRGLPVVHIERADEHMELLIGRVLVFALLQTCFQTGGRLRHEHTLLII